MSAADDAIKRQVLAEMKFQRDALPKEPIKCWCRRCKQDKREDEMFAAVVHPDGIAKGRCLMCAAEEITAENEFRKQLSDNL